MKARIVSFILSLLMALPQGWAAPSCEQVFSTPGDRTERAVFDALEETQTLFRLTEKRLEKLRERIRKEMSRQMPSERLRLARILNAVDTLLESRWMNFRDLVELDSAALTRRIVVQAKVLDDLQKNLLELRDFDSQPPPGQIIEARVRFENAMNLRRVAGSLALNGAYILGMSHFVGLIPVMPASVPLLRIRLPQKAIDRYNELRDQEIAVEEAADIVKDEFPAPVYSQASLKWSLVLFSAFSVVYTAVSLWENREKRLADALPFGHEILQEALKMDGRVRALAKAILETAKENFEKQLKTELSKTRREKIEEQLRRIKEDLRQVGAEAPSPT